MHHEVGPGSAFRDPILFGNRGHRISPMITFEGVMVVSYRLSIVTVALSKHLAAICRQMFPMLKSTGMGHLGHNLGKKG